MTNVIHSGFLLPIDVEVSNTADGTYSTAVNYEVSEEVITLQQLPSRKPGEVISAFPSYSSLLWLHFYFTLFSSSFICYMNWEFFMLDFLQNSMAMHFDICLDVGVLLLLSI